MENATTVFLVLSFDFETCSQDESWCFSFLKGCGVERFQCFYRYVRMYIYRRYVVLGEKKEAGND